MREEFDDELTQAFIQEGREFLDQLEPSIIELGQNCRDVICWELMNCDYSKCPRYEQKLSLPCWLDTGFIDKGRGLCARSKSKQDCLSCPVFQTTNGNNDKVNAIFRPFHSIKGTSGFLMPCLFVSTIKLPPLGISIFIFKLGLSFQNISGSGLNSIPPCALDRVLVLSR